MYPDVKGIVLIVSSITSTQNVYEQSYVINQSKAVRDWFYVCSRDI